MKKKDMQSLYAKFKSSALEEYDKKLYSELKARYDLIIEAEPAVLRHERDVIEYLKSIKEFLNEDEESLHNEDGRIYLKSTKTFLAMKAQFISKSNSLSSYEEYFSHYLHTNSFDKIIQSDKQSMLNILQKDPAITELFNNEEDPLSSLLKNSLRITCVVLSACLGYFLYKKYRAPKD